MSITTRLPRRAWILIPLLAFVFIALNAVLRIQRVRYVSGLDEWPVARPTGGAMAAAGWFPRMVVPGNNNGSFSWMDQTRQMFARGELRVRHVDYENAPFGHDVRSASPYRWWLGLLAWIWHGLSGRPLGASLETAALVADPLLYALLLLGAAVFVALRFGALAAALLSAALATLYPLAVGFLPGAPDDRGLVLALGLWSVLPLLAGIDAGRSRRLWFFVAGITGGLGLWIGVADEVPIIVGIGLGALVAAWIARREAAGAPAGAPSLLPWREWALGGAAASLGAYMVEYFPSHMGSWELRAVHPVYGLAWLGLGEALALAAACIQRGRAGWRIRDIGMAALAAASIAALPVAMRLTHNLGFISADLPMLWLTRLPNGVAASNLAEWIRQDGFSAIFWATSLPVLLVVPAILLLVRRGTGLGPRTSIAIAMGPALLALGFACVRLRWWNGFDAALLALLPAVTAALRGPARSRMGRWAWLCLAAVVLAPGAVQAVPPSETRKGNSLEESEIVGLIERDLARWLALHSPTGGGVILAPANATTALHHYGGFSGIATLDLENRDGLQAAIRIVSATTAEEARELIEQRGITYIVIPSWDAQLDSFAHQGLGSHLEGSFIYLLHQWFLFPWLRPVPYPIPVIGEFEGQSVVVMEVTEEQDETTLMARTTEYFVETGNLDLAASGDRALRRFPSDLGALVARARVEIARGETDAFGHTVDSLLPRLAGEGERTLPWDRRVSLAVVLAQGRHLDRARAEMQRCLADADDEKLRSLSTGSLYHLQVLGRALGMEIADPRLRKLALDLLPPDLEKRLAR